MLAKFQCDKDAVQVGGAFLGGAASGVPCSIWELCMIQQQRFGGSTLGTPRASLVNMARRRSARHHHDHREGGHVHHEYAGRHPLIQQKLVASSGMEKNAALAAGSLTGALPPASRRILWTRSRVACDLGEKSMDREKYE